MTLQGIDALVQLVRQQIDTEGLRPVARRTGIPVGQLRSFVRGRASWLTTLESVARAMGLQVVIGQVKQGGMDAPIPGKLTRALGLAPDASIAEALSAIERDAAGSRLRTGMHLMKEMTEGATTLAELLPGIAESTIRMLPFAEHVRFRADTAKWSFRSRPTSGPQSRSACCRPGRERLA